MNEPASTEPAASQPASFQVRVSWPAEMATQATPINHSAFAWDDTNRDVVYMMFGHVGPPLLLSQHDADQFIQETGGVLRVQPCGAYVVSRSRAEQIWEALGKHLGRL